MMQPQPWERQEGETTKAYAAFLQYLKISWDGRNIPKAYRAATGFISAKNVPGYFRDWATKYEWVKRARAHDNFELDEELKALEVQRKESRIRQAKAGREIIEAGRALLGETENVSAAAASEMILRGQKVENIALGVATEITETNVRGEVTVHGSIDKLLADPKTRGAALALLESVGGGEGHADGAGGVCEQRPVEQGKTPEAPQPEAH
jgi:hypothetical protein